MKTPRLIPVVIAATTALLLFKGVGLMTSGSYVLGGATTVQAAGGAPAAGHGGAAPAEGGDPTLELPHEATMADESPTLADESVTLPLGKEDPAGAHGDAPAEAEHPAEPTGGEAPAEAGHGEAVEVAAIAAACAPAGAEPEAADAHGGIPAVDCIPAPEPAATAESGDALPQVIAPSGKKETMVLPGSASAEPMLLERLGERRDELETRAAEIEMRMALVEAAEKRLEERTAELKVLEEQINALVVQKKSADEQQFVAIVAMYETMKPRDAATILNALDLPVLTKVVQQMNPRKMGPILAKMDPNKAKMLTTQLARQQVEPTVAEVPEDLTNLPQIVGQ